MEAAPSLLIYPARSSSFQRLETIMEEGSSEGLDDVKIKAALFILPVVVSVISFLLLCRHGV